MTLADERDFERILKALANRRRLAIIAFLKKKKQASVGDIASEIRLSFRATSRHLGVLYSADILEREQQSIQIFYRITNVLRPAARNIVSLL